MKRAVAGFGKDLAAAGGVLWDPVATFRALEGRSPLLAPWLVVSVLSMALSLLTISVSQRAASHLLGGEGELAAEVVRSLDHARIFSVVMAPLSVAVRWAFTAALLWAFAVWLVPAAGYRALLSVVAYSAVPGVLEQALDLAVAWREGPEFTPGLVPVFTRAASLGAWMPAFSSAWASALADRATLFGIWTAALWFVGLRTRHASGWRAPAAAVAPAWTLLWILGTAVEMLGRSLTGEAFAGG